MTGNKWMMIALAVAVGGILAYQSLEPTATVETKSSIPEPAPKPASTPPEAVEKTTTEDAKEVVLSSEEAKVMLVGIWRIDLDALGNDPEVKNAADAEKADALKLARDMMKNVAFEFAIDKQMGLFMDGQVRRGTYTIRKAEGDTLTVDTQTGAPDDLKKATYLIRVRAEALELTEVNTKITRRLVRGAPPTPADAADQ